MLSLSHLVVIIIAALIFLGPDKIPEFLQKCGEGIVAFKKIINQEENQQNKTIKNNKQNNKSNKIKKNKNHKINNKFKKNKNK